MFYPICVLQAIAFLDLLAVGLIIPLVPRRVRHLGGNQIHIGLLGSIYAGFQLVSGPLIGSLSDIKGRKTILMITLLICSIAYAVKGHTNSIVIILIIRAILGTCKQTQMLTKAMVADYEPDMQKQGDIYGKMMAISGMGITLGPIIGGHIAEDYADYGFTFIAAVVGSCFIINACLVMLLPKAVIRKTRRKTSDPNKSFLHSMSISLKQSFIDLYNVKWSHYWDIFLLKGLVAFAMGVYYSNYPLYLTMVYRLTPKYVGYIVSFQGVVGSVSSYFIGFIYSFYPNDKDFSQRNLHVFLMMTTSLIGMILSYNVYVFAFWLIPLSIGNAVGRLITLEMVLERGHGDHRGTLIGASNSVRSIAGIIAPMVAGVIGEFLGVTFVIYASLLSTVMGVFVSYQIKKRLKVD